MKKNKKPIVGAIIIGVGFVGLLGVFQSEDKLALVFGSFVIMAAGVVVLLFGLRANKVVSVPEVQPPQDEETPKSEPREVDGNRRVDLTVLTVGNCVKIYQYTHELCAIGGEPNPYDYVKQQVNSGNRQLYFSFEPDNEFDSEAIAIVLGGKKIGYVHKGTNQKMIHDYHNKGFQFGANISTLSPDRITYIIVFYKPKSKCRRYEFPIKNKAFAESCSAGDILSVEYDFVKDCFMLKDFAGEEICKLPKRAEEYANKDYEIPAEVGEDGESIIIYK